MGTEITPYVQNLHDVQKRRAALGVNRYEGQKINIGKKTLALFPSFIAGAVREWAERYKKKTFTIRFRDTVYISEDARLTAFGPDGQSMTANVGGEFAGLGDMLPGQTGQLPPGCWIVETGFFCGNPVCDVHFNMPVPDAAPALTIS